MHRARAFEILCLAVLVACCVHSTNGRARTASPVAKGDGEVRFTVRVDSKASHVICALFEREGWLKEPLSTARGVLRKGSADCVFTRVPKDTLAISAFADENDNGDLDTNWLGIPKEPWCASRNARGRFGPPSFDDASFSVSSGVTRLACTAR